MQRTIKPRKAKIIATLAALFLLPTTFSTWAANTPYYWVHTNLSAQGTTALEECQNYVATFKKYSLIGIGPYPNPEATNKAVCLLTYIDINNQLRPSTTTVTRHGNSCPSNKNYNPTTLGCSSTEEKGPPPQKCEPTEPYRSNTPVTGNPINFATGNKFQIEIDYPPKENSPLKSYRTYNSTDGTWLHAFSSHLRFFGENAAALVRSNGRESFFTISGTTVTSNSSDRGVLSKTSTGWLFVSSDNERFNFDTTGKLNHWSNTQGQSYQLAYSGNQITVTDNLGNSLTLTEDANHQPLSLTAQGVQITYGYNANNRLTSVNRTMGGQTTQRQYHYEVAGKPNLLTGITDERGIRYAIWAYDDQGRAISSEHADGADKVTVAYNSDGTVSVTNELGKVAKYSFQYIKGVKRITTIDGEPSPNCPSSNSTFTYDDRGLLKTKTDNKGNLTTYTYNARGLEISRTEASGTAQARTITTDWHADFFLPVKVTEPSRIITYQYDNHGRQINRNTSNY